MDIERARTTVRNGLNYAYLATLNLCRRGAVNAANAVSDNEEDVLRCLGTLSVFETSALGAYLTGSAVCCMREIITLIC